MHYLRLAKSYIELHITSKTDLIHAPDFCASTKPAGESRQPTEWEAILAKPVSGKGLILPRDEQFLQLVMVRVVCQFGWAMVPSDMTTHIAIS